MAAVGLDHWWQAYRWLDEQLHGPYPVIGDLLATQNKKRKLAADPIDRAMELAKQQHWAQDEEHSGQGNENMTSEKVKENAKQILQNRERYESFRLALDRHLEGEPSFGLDILETLQIQDWRKLNLQPTAVEISKVRDIMVRAFYQEPIFKIFGESGVTHARQADYRYIAQTIVDARTKFSWAPDEYDQLVMLGEKYRKQQEAEADAPLLVSFEFDDDLPIERPEYFIEETIPRSAEIVFIGGQSGAGKTFIAVHLGVCLASGVPFFGRAVERRTGTVILATEGAGTIKNRLRVARKQWVGDEPLPIAFRPQVVSLTNSVSVDELIRQLEALSRYFRRKFGVELGTVMLDTMTTAFELKDENDNAEANRIIRSLKWIHSRTGALVVPLHHYGKSAETGLRGASAWKGGTDVILSVLADRNEITGTVSKTELALAKSRVDAEGPIAPFALRFAALGKKPSGDAWGSLFVDPLLGEPSTIAGRARTPKEPAALVYFNQAFAKAMASAGIAVGIKTRNGSEVKAVRLSLRCGPNFTKFTRPARPRLTSARPRFATRFTERLKSSTATTLSKNKTAPSGFGRLRALCSLVICNRLK